MQHFSFYLMTIFCFEKQTCHCIGGSGWKIIVEISRSSSPCQKYYKRSKNMAFYTIIYKCFSFLKSGTKVLETRNISWLWMFLLNSPMFLCQNFWFLVIHFLMWEQRLKLLISKLNFYILSLLQSPDGDYFYSSVSLNQGQNLIWLGKMWWKQKLSLSKCKNGCRIQKTIKIYFNKLVRVSGQKSVIFMFLNSNFWNFEQCRATKK